jgi:hypothetical protein
MTEIRRCNRCGNPLRSDEPQAICQDCAHRALQEPHAGLGPADSSVGVQTSFAFEPTHPGHVLESLARSIGSIPRVLLPDTAIDDTGVPIIKPSSDEMPSAGDRGDRYQLFGEIARGGMGAVPTRGRPAEIEMIGSAMSGDFRPLIAPNTLGILGDLLNRCRNQFRISP